jgi:hypothetical protein
VTIGGETPAEIAVSIVGGLIAHHKGVRGVETDVESNRPVRADGQASSLEDPDVEEAKSRVQQIG